MSGELSELSSIDQPLRPLSSIQLLPVEQVTLGWLQTTSWKKFPFQSFFSTVVPEFYKGVHLHRTLVGPSAGGSLGALVPLLKKLEQFNIISRQEPFPVKIEQLGKGGGHLTLKKADLVNIGAALDGSKPKGTEATYRTHLDKRNLGKGFGS